MAVSSWLFDISRGRRLLFFPYQLDVDLKGIPFITYLVCLLCIGVFFQQTHSNNEYVKSLNSFCQAGSSEAFNALKAEQKADFCQQIFIRVGASHEPMAELGVVANEMYPAGVGSDLLATLHNEFARYKKEVPTPTTHKLWFDPDNASYQTMITSVFSHGDWEHLVSNLVFFFAFSVSAELLLGSVGFLAILLLSCITTSFAYQYGAFGFDNSMPTLGLSGLVMSVMGFIATIFPHKKMRAFYWLFVLFGVVRLPLLLLVAFYVGLDIYGLAEIKSKPTINYVTHVSGAATGAFVAMVYLAFNWTRASEL